MKFKFGLLPRVVLAIALGVACGFFLPGWATRIALTFNAIFGQFLGFAIPLLILGLVAPGIADLGRNARASAGPDRRAGLCLHALFGVRDLSDGAASLSGAARRLRRRIARGRGGPLRPISRSKCLP